MRRIYRRESINNSGTMTILDGKCNLYSSTSMPANLDAMLDAAHDQFGIDLPLIDLAISDPYSNALSCAQQGVYLGVSQAMGFSCHHLAFMQDNIDWQVWIQDGPQPLIRKFVITTGLILRRSCRTAPPFTPWCRRNPFDQISYVDCYNAEASLRSC
jgi:hypothetical protein